MKKMLALTLLMVFSSTLYAQLTKMQIIGRPEKSEMEIAAVRDPNGRFCAALQIISDAQGFAYEANNGVIRVDRQPGKDMVYLQPDERVVEIFLSGHEPLKIILSEIGIQLRERDVWIIRIKAQPRGMAIADENLFEITFTFNTTEVYCSYNQFAPILKTGNSATFKLPAGEYTFLFRKNQYQPLSQKMRVERDQTIPITLQEDVSQRMPYIPPGMAIISSEPSGAEVLINGQKMGTTPITVNLTAGDHQMELRKDLYSTDRSTFTLQGGTTQQITRKLIPRFGFLSVQGTPANADLILNGKPIGKSPVTAMEINSGAHTLIARMDLHHEFREEFTVQDNERKNISYELKAAYGTLQINSSPEEGAEVWIDGVQRGETPFSNTRMPSGRYQVEVRKKYFGPASEAVTVSDGQTTQRTLIMSSNVGLLSVKAPGASILINGKEAARNELRGYLSPGQYKIRVEKARHYPEEKEIFLTVGATEEVTFALVPMQGSVSVVVEPQAAANADITVNGEAAGKAPQVITLLIGNYNIGVQHKDYLPKTEKVDILENKNQQLRFQLMSYRGSQLQKKNSWKRWKYAALATAVVSAGAGYYFQMDADKKYDDYQQAMTVKEATDLHKQVDQSFLYSQIGFGVSITGAVVGLYSWIREARIKVER